MDWNDKVRLVQRRHPDGTPLYDVHAVGLLAARLPFGASSHLGTVRQHAGRRGWFAYTNRDEPEATNFPRRRDAINFLGDRITSEIAPR